MAGPETNDTPAAPGAPTRREREAEHRARNALQLVASLIQMQRRHDPAVLAGPALGAVLTRLAAISIAHRQTGWIDEREQVDVAAMIRDIAGDLARSSNRSGVSVELDLAPTLAPGHMAAPLALVVSETVGNALTHGFPEGRTGRIHIGLHLQGDRLALTIEDDGAGAAPQTFTPGFGLTLAGLMSHQIRGQLDISPRQSGFRTTLAAPVSGPAA